ncbi:MULTISPECIES: hypothetical protein [unclassified Pseudodesulfovibrio]|uniref:hypothetical protein n=1 Tax=unclassified Pseudodesulfovibrio TaxID=2661612 RepID=UPI000FEBA120|nr:MULTISPECIES: hypothetical protein [unclassified Pseudodesulfovibrio]MCJ2165668.1 hypothetical protein [Pseudodesulfovibrio sp. S3-i]RWU02933.1 hypothetical protein DWB63_13595 [Pseudodesulfovibrio sp. S3]
MSKAWIQAKHSEFVRDLFKFFCQACEQIEEQFIQFDEDGTIEFDVLKDLVGSEMNKGLLWRMKDTAHHVFRNDPHSQLGGKFLDWAMGYIFHETIKLKEDAYQKQNYAPWFHKLYEGNLSASEKDITEQLFQILNQTEESMRREIDRIRFIIAKCRQLLPYYLHRYSDNVLLARYIFSQNDLVRSVFADEYAGLIFAIYGSEPEQMYILASQSLRMGGWVEEAAQAVARAIAENPTSKMVLQEKKIIDNWSDKIGT